MKKLLLLLMSCCSLITVAYAQTNNSGHFGCGTMDVLKEQMQQDTAMAARMQQMELQIQKYLAEKQALRNQGNQRISDPTITIPIKFHILLKAGDQGLITNLVIQKQVDDLQKHFNSPHPTGRPWGSTTYAADTKIRFCKASVNRVTLSAPTRNYTSYTQDDPKIIADAPRDQNYLNVWVLDLNEPSNPTLGGYATMPGSISLANDGVVIDYRVFGTHPNNRLYYDQGKVLTHEVGHWLGLYHPWGDDTNPTCLNPDPDFVADTPPSGGPFNGICPPDGSSNCSSGSAVMFQNYMDYTYDGCKYLFTDGQAKRMYAQFEVFGYRRNILASPGCNPTAACPKPIGLDATFYMTTSNGNNKMNYRLNWAVPVYGSIIGFDVEWGIYTSTGTTIIETKPVGYYSLNPQNQELDIPGTHIHTLIPNTDYYFKVITKCQDNSSTPIYYSASSDIYTFKTPPALPAASSIFVGSLIEPFSSVRAFSSVSGDTPYGTYYRSQKVQYILTREEIFTEFKSRFPNSSVTNSNAFKCYLNSLYFSIKDDTGGSGNTSGTPFTPLNNFKIKIKEIDASITEFTASGNDISDFDGEFISMDGGMTVYNQNVSFQAFANTPPPTPFRKHEFPLPFEYNGTKNLLIEITFYNSNISNGQNTPVWSTQTRELNLIDPNDPLTVTSYSRKWRGIICSRDQDASSVTKGRLLDWRPIIIFDITPKN